MSNRSCRGPRGRERSTSPLWGGNRYPPEYYIDQIESMEAEEERRDHLAPQEKMAEDGAQLQRQLDQDPTMTLLLQRCQQTRYSLLPCDASECLIEQGRNRQTATFRHRILVDVAFGDSYHVPCLEAMLDLPRLAPSRFMLDTKPYRWNHNAPWRWGFMFQKWFEYSGRVDLTKIATYFEEMDAYLKERDDWSTRYIEWQFAHGECKTDCGASGCSPEPPSPPERPVRDYTTEDGNDGKVCPLSDVLNHTDSWRPMMP
ncbi:hypothetical protein FOQG_17971 [Fusarium oxysporum f. sp. raphani 54005]|uniref:Uncharacterized protein n=2 Tax=Fusarium oxysporum f. sp. raphani TaxID=96318 RepID=X0B6D4_FUSOX|nr:hypothetical protein FOQG_17971 [Fusarium oxysporum f. sp. raphani 54005]KAG7435029.1 hypothetical protein Forpi1262_v005403 [Fusarium oxysporum f. sp. raphani]